VDLAAVEAAVVAAGGRDHQRVVVEVEEGDVTVDVKLLTAPYGGVDQAMVGSCKEATNWAVAAAIAMLRPGARGCIETRAALWVDVDPWLVSGAAARLVRWQGRPSWTAMLRAGYGFPTQETTFEMWRVEAQAGLGPALAWPLPGGAHGPPARLGLTALGRVGFSSVSWRGLGSDQSATVGAEAGVEIVSAGGLYASLAATVEFRPSNYALTAGGPAEIEGWRIHPTAEVGWILVAAPTRR
jgi:hypothetical protein